MKCTDCPYSWINGHWNNSGSEFIPDEKYPSCHYDWNDGYAPCEAEETEYYYDEEE